MAQIAEALDARPRELRCLDQPTAVSLEEILPRDHFYHHLETKLDFSFVREWVRERFAAQERPSLDPIVFFPLPLVMVFAGIRAERQLIETASLNLAHRVLPVLRPRRATARQGEPHTDSAAVGY